MSWEEIQKLQMEIYHNYDKIGQLRKELEPEPVSDYVFTTDSGDKVTLNGLFGKRSTLMVVHNMGKQCDYCTAWADGFSGIYDRLNAHTAFVVSNPDAPEVQTAMKNERGWVFPMVSVENTTFTQDMGYQSEESDFYPGVSIFVKTEDGAVQRTYHAPFGPSDHYGVVWHMLDLLPSNPMM